MLCRVVTLLVKWIWERAAICAGTAPIIRKFVSPSRLAVGEWASGRVSERVKWTGVNDSFSCCQECRRWRRRKTSQSTVSPGTTARKRRKNVDTGNLQHDSTSLFTYDNNTNRLQLFVLYNTVQFKNNFTLRDLFTSCTMEIDISN